MSTIRTKKISHPSATEDQIVLNTNSIDLPASTTLDGNNLESTLASKAPTASPTFTGNVVWSGAVLRASSNSVATEQTTTSTSYTDLATSGPTVTLTTGTKALVIFRTVLRNSNVGFTTYASVAVSGATTTSASDSWSLYIRPSGSNGEQVQFAAQAHLFTGLTAGSNTFTMKYRVEGNTATYANRSIIVIDMGS